MEGSEITEEGSKKAGEDLSLKKKIFVAGATGSTGRRIVEQLLANGFAVKAGVRDLDKANTSLSRGNNPALQIVSFSPFLGARNSHFLMSNGVLSILDFLFLFVSYLVHTSESICRSKQMSRRVLRS